VVDAGLRGGLVVAPSAPVLVALQGNEELREAVTNADIAIADSGLMVILWRVLHGRKMIRVSGLEYLRQLLAKPIFTEPNSAVWVMPNARARRKLFLWLPSIGIPASDDTCYLAPQYPEGKLVDRDLLELVLRRRPEHVIIALGGGVQERLGYYLKQHLGYRPGIHCIGGALGFLTGDQVRIPRWADRLYMGWFVRSLSHPLRFLPRYLSAWRLVGIVWRYGENLPPLQHRRN
jgi:UDP-N-acetyl-D-mannosaminuronic acid transferase (WecB/TagA/CpsF family)